MAKKVRVFDIEHGIDGSSVTWFDRATEKAVMTIQLGEIEPEHMDKARQFFTCYGMQKFLEDRTSGVKGGVTAKVTARVALWEQICEHGHTFRAEGNRAGPTVSAEVEAIAEIKGISVSAAQKALAEYDEETRERIKSSETVQKVAERIKAERKEAEGVDLEDLAS